MNDLLERIIDTSDVYYSWSHTPVFYRDHLWATNGHILIGIKSLSGECDGREDIFATYADDLLSLRTRINMREYRIPELTHARLCVHCLGSGHSEPCPVCDGDEECDRCHSIGYVQSETEWCSECFGSGVQFPEYFSMRHGTRFMPATDIYGVPVSHRYLSLLSTLQPLMIYAEPEHDRIKFRTVDAQINGVVMGVRNPGGTR